MSDKEEKSESSKSAGQATPGDKPNQEDAENQEVF